MEDKDRKRILICKEVVKVSLFADDMILYHKDPKTVPKNS
jgi:hypothetical protein